MSIHHAVVKSAASKGVILTHEELTVTAHMPEPNRRVTLDVEPEDGDAPTQAEYTERARDAWSHLSDILAWEAEHPGIRIEQHAGDFVAIKVTAGKKPKEADEIARDPEFEDLIETLNEYEENGSEGMGEDDDDEAEETGSVVPAKYKAEYAARGNPNHCGDWLAETLARLCRVMEDGKEVTDIDRLEVIANANDVAPARYGKLGLATNGWQGRFRMTIRNMMVPRIAAKGFLFVPEGCGVDADKELAAPKQWCLEHSPKPKAKKDPKAAVSKDAGAGKPSAKTKAQKGQAGVKAATAAVKAAVAKTAKK